MTWRQFIRTIEADSRRRQKAVARSERESMRQYRELAKRQRELEKQSEKIRAENEAAQFENYLELLVSVLKAAQAVSGTKKWAINGSEKEGAKMVTDFCKLMLRAYNTEADNLVRTLRPYTVKTAVERLQKMRVSISKLGASMKIEITDAYHAMRTKELELTSDYLAKVADEKERDREEKARLKEEAAARKEYEAEQTRLEKERPTTRRRYAPCARRAMPRRQPKRKPSSARSSTRSTV